VRILIGALALVVGACAGKSDQAPDDSLSTRARQEAIGRSGIPGARGINRALEIADTARARIEALDTLR
jgi:hypothetical protein